MKNIEGDPKIINSLAKIAQDVIPVRSARIAAAMVLGNDIVSIGINSKKTDPFQLKYARDNMPQLGAGEQYHIYQHAEIAAIKKAMNRISMKDIENCKLYVVRLRHDDYGWWEFGLAKPCPICMGAIYDFNIKNVFWTINQPISDKYLKWR